MAVLDVPQGQAGQITFPGLFASRELRHRRSAHETISFHPPSPGAAASRDSRSERAYNYAAYTKCILLPGPGGQGDAAAWNVCATARLANAAVVLSAHG